MLEDQGQVRKYVAAVLTKYGYRVLQAQSMSEALAVSATEAGAIDLILTDVVMPEASGREAATRVAELRPGIRVLFMSGYTDEVIGRHGVLDEGTNFIQKPFTPEDLVAKIRAPFTS